MSEIPMYPDECEHGNTHIEGVNECAICERDSLRTRYSKAHADCQEMADRAKYHSEMSQRLGLDVARMRTERDVALAQVERLTRERDEIGAARDELADIAEAGWNELAQTGDWSAAVEAERESIARLRSVGRGPAK